MKRYKKTYLRHARILLAVLILLMIAGSIWDLPISRALYPGRESSLGQFFAAFGEQPAFLAISCAGALLLLPWAFALIARVKWLGWLNALFALLGKWSFEIFLVHLLLFGYMNELGVEMRGNLAWLAAIAVSVVLSVGYGKLIEHLRKRKQ